MVYWVPPAGHYINQPGIAFGWKLSKLAKRQPFFGQRKSHASPRSSHLQKPPADFDLGRFTLFKVFLATDLAFLVYRLARDYDPGEVQDKADSLASIPLPLTTRQLPPEVYDKRGPEWTEFKRFAQDDDAQRKVRCEFDRL